MFLFRQTLPKTTSIEDIWLEITLNICNPAHFQRSKTPIDILDEVG